MNNPSDRPERAEEDDRIEELGVDTIAWKIERFANRVHSSWVNLPHGVRTEEGILIRPRLFRMEKVLRQLRQEIADAHHYDDFEHPKFLLAAMESYYRELTAEIELEEPGGE